MVQQKTFLKMTVKEAINTLEKWLESYEKELNFRKEGLKKATRSEDYEKAQTLSEEIEELEREIKNGKEMLKLYKGISDN